MMCRTAVIWISAPARITQRSEHLLAMGALRVCGTLIAPDWVLTDAHLVDIASSGTFTIDGTTYSSTALFTDPGWTNVFLVTILLLVTTCRPGVSPVMLTPARGIRAGRTYVGYGYTGTGLTGWQTLLDNQKRAFQNVISRNFGNPSLLLGGDFENPHTTADAQPLEGCVAPGDSGGGVFLTI